MFLGAMIIGPLAAWLLKQIDGVIAAADPCRLRDARRQLQRRHPRRRAWRSSASCHRSDRREPRQRPRATASTALVDAGLLPLASIIVEPAKVLFLNNAINHGVLGPLGVPQALETGKSILFMIETNPGPGLGHPPGRTGSSVRARCDRAPPGAIIIHFFGGIHEIYFPYVLANPRLILAAIARRCIRRRHGRRDRCRPRRHPVARAASSPTWR